jgi:hypothetical protein
MKNFGIVLLLSLIIFSCNKVEGEGGTSSIMGTLTVEEYKNNGDFKGSYLGADEDVFIIYGKENTTFNDKVTTSYDGTYRIDNLVAGTYKLFSYSKDTASTSLSGSKEVLVEVNISAKGELVIAPELTIQK